MYQVSLQLCYTIAALWHMSGSSQLGKSGNRPEDQGIHKGRGIERWGFEDPIPYLVLVQK